MPERKVRISYDDFDALIGRIQGYGEPLDGWYPTPEQAGRLAEDPVGNYEFIIYILESNPGRELDGEQKEAERILNRAIMGCTKFTDG